MYETTALFLSQTQTDLVKRDGCKPFRSSGTMVINIQNKN